MLQSLSHCSFKDFYDEELKLREELALSPFKHWVKLCCRGKSEKSVHQAAGQVYNELNGPLSEDDCAVTPPLADAGRT